MYTNAKSSRDKQTFTRPQDSYFKFFVQKDEFYEQYLEIVLLFSLHV